MRIFQNVLDCIGKTPLVDISGFVNHNRVKLLAKLEYFNPGASVKDRLALSLIQEAEKSGIINSETIIIEPSSGNTGIGLAMVCAVKSYKCIIVMPESMSIERRQLIRSFGAEIRLSPADSGMKGAILLAEELQSSLPNAWIPQQFSNPANALIHRNTTAIELWDDTDGKIEAFVAGIGTGGTITGVGEVLKSKNPQIHIMAVEPKDSPVLSGGTPGKHKIQGIGAGFIPQVLNTNIYNEIFQVDFQDAVNTSRKLATKFGIFSGFSSGANVFAASQLAQRSEFNNKIIVVMICDTGERYLSTELFDN
jgi:cysteine synthase